MPPCAAILCARRGESWKQKHFTLYPSSPRVAAAEAPARPLPTTIISNFGRLFGATNFDSPRCLSHFFSSGPDGTFESSVVAIALLEDAEEDRDRNRNIAREHHPGQSLSTDRNEVGYFPVIKPQRLDHARESVSEMGRQQKKPNHVEQ